MSSKTIILVTGANSGIGYDTSYFLVKESSNTHVIMACRNPSKGQKALSELVDRKPAGTLSLMQLDVSDDAQIAAAVKKIEADFGVLDVLVNNAGLISQSSDQHAALRETFESNAFGPYLLTEALVPLLKKSINPRLINVTSELGSVSLRTSPDHYSWDVPYDIYRMSKSALNMITACQYHNFMSWGCKVWPFCPGYVISNLNGERENKEKMGIPTSETSAQGILEIVRGDRDSEVGKFIAKDGNQHPW